jgi:hypothetical protein
MDRYSSRLQRWNALNSPGDNYKKILICKLVQPRPALQPQQQDEYKQQQTTAITTYSIWTTSELQSQSTNFTTGTKMLHRCTSGTRSNHDIQRSRTWSDHNLYYNWPLRIILGPPIKTSPAESLQPLCTKEIAHRNPVPSKSRDNKTP